MRYFGSNIVEGVAESLVEAEMSWVEADGAGWSWEKVDGAGWSWVELGARFSNTLLRNEGDPSNGEMILK